MGVGEAEALCLYGAGGEEGGASRSSRSWGGGRKELLGQQAGSSVELAADELGGLEGIAGHLDRDTGDGRLGLLVLLDASQVQADSARDLSVGQEGVCGQGVG